MPDKYIRAFIALDLSQPIKKYLETLLSGMKKTSVSSIKWVRPEILHITMKFLGNIKNDQVHSIKQCLKQTMARHAPIKTTVSGIGFFSSKDKAHILWVGFNDPNRLLTSLADNINKNLNALGFPMENKKFLAHATLARLKAHPAANAWLKQLSTLSVATDMSEIFDHITLYQSTLTHQGPVYQAIELFYTCLGQGDDLRLD